jgi:calcineurin-like phosphoesterase family protein
MNPRVKFINMAHIFNRNKIYDPDKTWFFSDPHFGHDNVLKFEKGYHNFNSIEDHDQAIISNWNMTVQPGDTVFFLGDAAMPRTKLTYLKEVFAQLNGSIIWIRGNHDDHTEGPWLNELSQVANILEFTYYKEIFIPDTENTSFPDGNRYLRKLVLFHYPIFEHNGKGKGVYHLYGHSHEKLHPIFNAHSVCACLTDYTPVNFDWIKKKMNIHNEGLDRPGELSL